VRPQALCYSREHGRGASACERGRAGTGLAITLEFIPQPGRTSVALSFRLLGSPHVRARSAAWCLENARLDKLVNLNFETKPDVRWLTDGSQVPDHISCTTPISRRLAPRHKLVLPAHVLFDDKTTADCHVLSMATPGLGVAVVSHPGVVINHPLVKDGRAWEVLHNPPRRGDIGNLRPVQRDVVRFLRGGGVRENQVVGGSEFSWLTGMFDYEGDQLPVPRAARSSRRASTVCCPGGRCFG
jgi:hypothetical protein